MDRTEKGNSSLSPRDARSDEHSTGAAKYTRRECRKCGAAYEPKGWGGLCLPCRRVSDKAWRARRKAEGRPVFYPSPPGYHATYNRLRRAKIPTEALKMKARESLRNAVVAGKVTRGPCAVCGTTSRIEGHHHDYSKPFDVTWLCRTHHRELHQQAGA